MNGPSGFREVRSSAPDHHRIGSCTSNSLDSEQVPDTVPVSRNLSLSILVLGALLLWLPCSWAADPITPSGLLHTDVGPPIIIGPTTQYDITGGTRPGGVSGTNLFHSFGDFNVPTNNIANFLNVGSVDLHGNVFDFSLPTSNILGTVTGVNPSTIFGMIQTNGPGGFPNANLFLMNPHGFLFGPNATVNVGGMMTFTTADYLRFQGADTLFNKVSTPESLSLLSTVPVAAFGFLGSNPGAITVQGSQFTVTEGKGISLVGGNITVQSGVLDDGITIQPARLSAPNGKIQLASAVSPGEFDAATLQPLPNVSATSFTFFGTVSLASGSYINVTGEQTISIRGGQFVLSVNDAVLSTADSVGAPETIALSSGSSIISSNAGPDPGANVRLTSSNIQLDGASIQSLATGNGSGGNISITAALDGGPISSTAGSISLKDASSISSSSNSELENAGNAGEIRLNAPVIDVQTALISASTVGPGNAGNIVLEANRVSLGTSETGQLHEQGADIFTRTTGPGQAGDITIRGRNGADSQAEIVTISGFSRMNSESFFGRTDVQGDAGNISIHTGRMTLSDGTLSTTSESSTGNAGTITIVASDEVTISSNGRLSSGAIEFASGNGGRIAVSAPTVVVERGGFISTDTDYVGHAGEIQIKANSVQLKTGGHISSSSIINQGAPDFAPSGSAGIITVQGLASPAQSVLIDGSGSGLFTDTQGTGAGGNIFVNANSVTLQNGGELSAKTSGTEATATGGTITVDATNTVTMNSASITTSSTGAGDAGNIHITAGQNFTATDSSVTTQADAAGGGAIKITTNPGGTVQLINSLISASVLNGAGGGGSVNIDPQFVILLNSQILANAVQGPGGNISITTNFLLPDANSVISASSQFGVNGTVTIQSPNAPISGHIQPLGKSPLLATSLFNQRCASLAGGEFSSFTVAGRNSLPIEPGSWLASPLYAEGMGTGEGLSGLSSLSGVSGVVRGGLAAHQIDQTNQINQTNPALLSLRQIAPAGFLTQTFAVDEPTGCKS